MKRVVTGWDESGKPTILFEGEPPTVMDFGPIVTTELWVTDALAARPEDAHRHLDGNVGSAAARRRPGIPHRDVPPAVRVRARRHPADGPDFLEAHATDTIDLIAVISGEITMVFEGREITLRPGDSVVQQGTPHDWVNKGTVPCVVAGVLVSTRA